MQESALHSGHSLYDFLKLLQLQIVSPGGRSENHIFAGAAEVHHDIQVAQAWVPSASHSILCNRGALNETSIMQLPDMPARDPRDQQQLPQRTCPSAVPTEAEDLEPGLQQRQRRSQGSSGQKDVCRNESSCKNDLAFSLLRYFY